MSKGRYEKVGIGDPDLLSACLKMVFSLYSTQSSTVIVHVAVTQKVGFLSSLSHSELSSEE